MGIGLEVCQLASVSIHTYGPNLYIIIVIIYIHNYNNNIFHVIIILYIIVPVIVYSHYKTDVI